MNSSTLKIKHGGRDNKKNAKSTIALQEIPAVAVDKSEVFSSVAIFEEVVYSGFKQILGCFLLLFLILHIDC